MRDYDSIKEYVRKLKKSSDYITETDLYDIYSLIASTLTDYEKEIDSSKYEELQDIYDKLNVAATTHPLDYSSYIDFDEDVPDKNDRTLIEEILERVHLNSGIRKHENEVHQILVETIGWYFNEFDVIETLRSYFLKNASSEILDEYAYQYGLVRDDGETDDSLRNRILAYMKETYTVQDVEESGIELFTFVDNPYTQLTSKNTYLSRKYLAHGDETMMNYWDSRYITWRDIVWF